MDGQLATGRPRAVREVLYNRRVIELTPEQIEQIENLLSQVALTGNGEVVLVVHNGRVRYITVSVNVDIIKPKTPE